jgi:hypothetical protein
MSKAVAGVHHWLKAAKKRSNRAAVPGLRLRPTPCGTGGVQNLTWHGTLVAQASQIDIISCGERGSAYCGALVMRSDGVCMIIGIDRSVLDSEFVHQVVSQTSCWQLRSMLLRMWRAPAALRRHEGLMG